MASSVTSPPPPARVRRESDAPVVQGVLFKQSDHFKLWNERYFRIDGQRLLYWESRDELLQDARPRGLLKLSERCVGEQVVFDASAQLWTFTVQTDGRSYVLAAPTSDEAEKWRAALATASRKETTIQRIVQMEKDEFDDRFERLPAEAKTLYQAAQPDAAGWRARSTPSVMTQYWDGDSASALPCEADAGVDASHGDAPGAPSRVGTGNPHFLSGRNGVGVISAFYIALSRVHVIRDLSYWPLLLTLFLFTVAAAWLLTARAPVAATGALSFAPQARLRQQRAGIFACALVALVLIRLLFGFMLGLALAAAMLATIIVMCLDESFATHMLDTYIDVCRTEKATVVINHPPDVVARMLASFEQRRHWDVNLATARVTHVHRHRSAAAGGARSAVGRMVFRAAVPELVSPRELCLEQALHYVGRSTFIVTEHSTVHASCPFPTAAAASSAATVPGAAPSPPPASAAASAQSWLQKQFRMPARASFRGGFVVSAGPIATSSSSSASSASSPTPSATAAQAAGALPSTSSTVTFISQRRWNAPTLYGYAVARMVPMRELAALKSIDAFLTAAPAQTLEDIEREFGGAATASEGSESDDDVSSSSSSSSHSSRKRSDHAVYLALAEQAALRIVEYCRGTEADGWERFDERDGVTFSRKAYAAGAAGGTANETTALRGRGVVPFAPETLVELISDGARRTKFDAMFSHGGVIEELSPYIHVLVSAFKMPWPVSPRDFCSVTLRARTRDGAWVIAVTSCEHERGPPVEGTVRGHIIQGGWLIQPSPTNAKSCTAYYVSHSDPGGSLPTSVVKGAAGKQPAIIANLRKYLESTPAEVVAHASEAAKLRAFFESPETPVVQVDASEAAFAAPVRARSASDVKCVTVNGKRLTAVDEPAVDAPQAGHTAAASTPVKRRVSMPATTLGAAGVGASPSSASPAASASSVAPLSPRHTRYLQIADRALESLLELSQLPETAWEAVKEEAGVAVSRRAMPGSPLYCIRGVGVVDAAAADILAFFTNTERRKWYDEMCVEARTVAKYDSSTYLAYTRFEARGWFCARFEARDFLVIHKHTRLQDGAIVLGGCSINEDDDRAPVGGGESWRVRDGTKECIRGTVLAGGWVIRPSLRQADRSLLSYYMHVDLGGSVPAWAINLVAEKQPMVINEIKKMLESGGQ